MFYKTVANGCDGTALISCERPNGEPITVPVRRIVLFNALLWLKNNNHLYQQSNLSSWEALSSENEDTCIQSHKECMCGQFGLIGKDTLPYTEPVTELINVQNYRLPIATGRPVSFKDICFGEEIAFPWLFPYGINGIGTARKVHLTDLSYFHLRLYSKDCRWRCDIPYVMSCLNQHE